jgi:thioredoxin 1
LKSWKKYSDMAIRLLFLYLMLCSACSRQEGPRLAPPAEYSQLMQHAENPVVLDIRTAGEFENAHLENALNMNFYASDFKQQLEGLDKSKEVFVYCLSGGRSKKCAQILVKKGFKVTELKGGICAWKRSKLPVVKGAVIREQVPLGKAEFIAELDKDKLHLIDFTAPWCLPCKKMAVALLRLDSVYSGNLKIHRIDYDIHRRLASDFQVEELPAVMLIRNSKILWTGRGLTAEKELLREVEKHIAGKK